jgi:hypothetical protein
MLRSLKLLIGLPIQSFRPRRELLLENLALRQQLAVLKLRHPQPRLAAPDKLFWVILRRLWPGRKQALILVQLETVGVGIGRDSSCTGRSSRAIATAPGENA